MKKSSSTTSRRYYVALLAGGIALLWGGSVLMAGSEKTFDLAPDQAGTLIHWRAVVDGQPHEGTLTRLAGGLMLNRGSLNGASGKLTANLRYIFTGKPMWDMYVSELFFGVVDPRYQDAVITIKQVQLGPHGSEGSRRGHIDIDLRFPRGGGLFTIPVEVTSTSAGWHARSLVNTALDFGALGYGTLLSVLPEALGVSSVGKEVSFGFSIEFKTQRLPDYSKLGGP